MTDKNFITYFRQQLEKVKEDLTDLQYDTLADAANFTPTELGVIIKSLDTDKIPSVELNWLYSLTQPSITKVSYFINPLNN
jgi:hypothetical protein